MALNFFIKFPNVLFIIVLLLLIRRFLENNLANKKYQTNFLIGNAQDIGKRKRQEDSFATIKNENGVLAVLADGMGGFSAGKKASELVVKTFLEEFSRTYDINTINKFLINTTYISNAKVLEFSEDNRMGTTLVAAMLNKNSLYWITVGDSRIYLYRNKELKLINEEHVLANKLKKAYKAGQISRYEAFNHPREDQLTSYLGYEDFHEIDYSKPPIKLEKGDKIMLCSDGISKGLSDLELEELLAIDVHPLEISEMILESVLDKHIINQDNATLIVIEKLR
jgi:serine/threonine protein phosphatase PrpC